MQKVARNSGAQIIYSRPFLFNKYRCPAATPHRHAADAKLPDLMSVPTVSIPLSACVLKSPVWRTEFVTTHTHPPKRKMLFHRKLSAQNNVRRESLTKGNISKHYKNVIHLLKGHNLEVKLIVTSCARNVLKSVM